MDKAMIEYYHNTGQMPDWVYYQVNGKSFEENYNEICKKRHKELETYFNAKHIEKQIEKELEKTIDKALDDVLKKFNA